MDGRFTETAMLDAASDGEQSRKFTLRYHIAEEIKGARTANERGVSKLVHLRTADLRSVHSTKSRDFSMLPKGRKWHFSATRVAHISVQIFPFHDLGSRSPAANARRNSNEMYALD
jgi:hypothetical protein